MRTLRRISLILTLALVAAGCGGSGADAPNTGGGGGSGNGGGEIIIGGDLDLPDYFPADFYLPEGVTVQSVTGSADAAALSLSGTYEGDHDAIRADMVAGLQAAGYELLSDGEDISVFIKDGVGRIRIRAREFLGEPTLTVDIDQWTDEQIAELRDLSAEEVTVTGMATATYDGETIEVAGECILQGSHRQFYAEEGNVSLSIDERPDPPAVYADITTDDDKIYSTFEAQIDDFSSSPQALTVRGEMVELYSDAAPIDFVIEVSCDA